MVSTTLLQIKYRPEFHNEDGLVTAVCRELGLAAPGKTNEEAGAALSSTVGADCDILERRGVLAKTLAESGVITEEISVDKESNEDVVLVVGTGRSNRR